MDGESDGYQRFASSRVCAKSKFSGSIYSTYIYIRMSIQHILYTHIDGVAVKSSYVELGLKELGPV